MPMHPLPPGHPPRTFLFKLLNYKDRDVILAKARNMVGALAMDNTNICLFPDYSAEVQKQRAKFTDVKRSQNPQSIIGHALSSETENSGQRGDTFL